MTGRMLPSELTFELYQTYSDLVVACQNVRNSILQDGEDYPIYLPTYDSLIQKSYSSTPRTEAIASITQIYAPQKGQNFLRAGLLCASPDTINSIKYLNVAKDEFKAAVMAIRNFAQTKETAASRISSLIREEITERGHRSDVLQHAMATTGITSIDLKRAYAHVRIIEPNLESFSWTWAANHSRIKKLSMDQAVELASSLSSPEASQAALSLIGQCPPSQEFAIRTPLANQLRANYVYSEEGARKRKSCTISGIVAIQQKHLPKRLWRDDPGEKSAPRLDRETAIEEDVYIRSLNIHRYL